MTKERLIELLKSGIVEEFNELKDTFESDLDLSENDFSQVELYGAKLSEIDFSGCDFSETNLEQVNFSKCNLSTADFTRSNLTDVNFSESVLSGAKFNNSSHTLSDFADCDLCGADFSESDLGNSDLTLSVNITSCKYDKDTIWPESDKLPYDFEPSYESDLALLEDDDDESADDIY